MYKYFTVIEHRNISYKLVLDIHTLYIYDI